MKLLPILLFSTIAFGQVPQIPGTDTIANTRRDVNTGLTWLDANKLHPAGNYSPGTTYAQGDMVFCISAGTPCGALTAGLSYVSLQGSNIGHSPASANTWWTPIIDPTVIASGTASAIAGGTTGQYPVQTGAGATGFKSPNVPNGPMQLDSNGNGSIGTTLIFDSGNFGSFSAACAAAVSAHAQLMISKGWTGITTQSCAANVIAPIGTGGATVLQPASGQTITLTGDIMVPHGTAVFDTTLGGFVHLKTPTINASWFAGAGAAQQINACITAVISSAGDSGECDARDFGGVQTMSQQINLGTSSSGTAGLTILLRLPVSATWTWALTDGTSCGIKAFNNTLIQGFQAAGGQGSTVLHAPGSASMRSMLCTDPSPSSGGNYIRFENFGIVVDVGATMSEGAAHIQYLFDESLVRNVIIFNASGDALHLTAICCGPVIDNAQGSSAEASGGGYPLLIDGGGNAFTISNSTFNFPGVGKNNMNIGVAAPTVANITFLSDYMEKRGATDFGTPMVEVGGNAWNVKFIGGGAAVTTCSSCAQVVFQNDTYYGFSVEHFGVSGTSHGVYDTPNARAWPTDGIQIQGYSVGLANNVYLQGITTNSLTGPGPGSVSGVCWKADKSIGYGTPAEITAGTCH